MMNICHTNLTLCHIYILFELLLGQLDYCLMGISLLFYGDQDQSCIACRVLDIIRVALLCVNIHMLMLLDAEIINSVFVFSIICTSK